MIEHGLTLRRKLQLIYDTFFSGQVKTKLNSYYKIHEKGIKISI